MSAIGKRELVIRRNVSLYPEENDWLEETAWQQRKSVSALLRDVIDFYREHGHVAKPHGAMHDNVQSDTSAPATD